MNLHDHDPVDLFAHFLQKKFSERTGSFLADAVAGAEIDRETNAILAKNIDSLFANQRKLSSRVTFWSVIALLLIMAAVITGVFLLGMSTDGKRITPTHWCIAGGIVAASLWLLFGKCIPAIRRARIAIAGINSMLAEKLAEARAQIAPLFDFFDWDTVTNLVGEVFPDAVFDKFMYGERLDDLLDNFGFNMDFTGNKSVLDTHSGTLMGYPFVFLNTNTFSWGTKTYTGSIYISWRGWSTDSKGKPVMVNKSETITATITKPYPEFKEEKLLVFGHDAAPELSFSRKPSSLSGSESSFFKNIGKSLKIGKLKRFERNLTDESEYTMMSNRDFELLFCATDRDDEVAFRLLYTPLAQQYMVKLLNDGKVGYGDDFMYFKSRMITSVVAEHLNELDFSTIPMLQEEYDLNRVLQMIQHKFEDFFKRIYFTFAPLLTVPLYLEERPAQTLTAAENASLSPWEIEAAANYQGNIHYKHPSSITENLLKVTHFITNGRSTSAQITATGFKGIPRVEYVSKLGGDGKIHEIPIKWTEYIEVERTSTVSAENIISGSGNNTAGAGNSFRKGVLMSYPQN